MIDPPASPPRILTLDLSLTSTGWCALWQPAVITNAGLFGMERLAYLRARVAELLSPHLDLVVLEGYSYGSKGASVVNIGELGGVIRLLLHQREVRFVEVPPSSLKKYATGKGNAAKDEVLVEAVRRLGYEGSSHDEADAMWLWVLAMDAAGHAVATVPAAHREAISKPLKKQPSVEEQVRAALYDRDFDTFRGKV